MNLMRKNRDSTSKQKFVTYKDFKERLSQEIIATCDFSSNSRPAKKVLIGQKSQMTSLVAKQIGAILIRQLEADGYCIEVYKPGAESEIDVTHPKGLRDCTKDVMSALTRTRREATDEDSFALARKMLGTLINIGVDRKVKRVVYVALRGATPQELYAAADHAEKSGRRTAKLTAIQARAVRDVAKRMENWGCSNFEEGEILHTQEIRQGRTGTSSA